MNSFGSLLQKLHREYIALPEQSPEEIEAFHRDLGRTSMETYGALQLPLLVLLVATSPIDYWYLPEPLFWAAMKWKLWMVGLGGGFVLIISLPGVFSYLENYPNWSGVVVPAVTYGPFMAISGYYLSRLGQQYPSWLYALCLFPFATLTMTGGFWKRVALNSLSFLCLPTIYLQRGFSLDFFVPFTVLFVVAVSMSILVGHFHFYRLSYLNYFAEKELAQEKELSERLLLNILPEPIAQRLKEEELPIADRYEEASVLFADLVGFTEIADELPPDSVVALLNRIFGRFDEIIGDYDIEKIKMVGDEYFAAAGLPRENENHAVEAAHLALDLRDAINELNQEEEHELQIRMGLNTGPLVAGVIGQRKFAYDVWGDTVNVGSRMESQGVPGKIQVTPSARDTIMNQDDEDLFTFQERGTIEVKGRGEMTTYFLGTNG